MPRRVWVFIILSLINEELNMMNIINTYVEQEGSGVYAETELVSKSVMNGIFHRKLSKLLLLVLIVFTSSSLLADSYWFGSDTGVSMALSKTDKLASVKIAKFTSNGVVNYMGSGSLSNNIAEIVLYGAENGSIEIVGTALLYLEGKSSIAIEFSPVNSSTKVEGGGSGGSTDSSSIDCSLQVAVEGGGSGGSTDSTSIDCSFQVAVEGGGSGGSTGASTVDCSLQVAVEGGGSGGSITDTTVESIDCSSQIKAGRSDSETLNRQLPGFFLLDGINSINSKVEGGGSGGS